MFRYARHGLSPLAREIRLLTADERIAFRFIPARAGNTLPMRSKSAGNTVYPRSRGKYIKRHVRAIWQIGLSPLAREIRFTKGLKMNIKRFIPARAGNTIPHRTRFLYLSVYPRSRGKYGMTLAQLQALSGLSPLAREIRHIVLRANLHGRFIPARAGNTGRRRPADATRPVYPRSRGKYCKVSVSIMPTSGLSPLAREIRAWQCEESRSRRFIPARAGNTSGARGCGRCVPVYPRSRGKYWMVGPYVIKAVGLSPLAREIRAAGAQRGRLVRFIPARAGNTPKRIFSII